MSKLVFLIACLSVCQNVSSATERSTMTKILDESIVQELAAILERKHPHLTDDAKLVSHDGYLLMVGYAKPEVIRSTVDEARQIRGVRRIYNELSSSMDAERTDDTRLEKNVSRAIGGVSRHLTIVVEGGEVYLLGKVKPREGAQIARAASKVTGVTRVVKMFDESIANEQSKSVASTTKKAEHSSGSPPTSAEQASRRLRACDSFGYKRDTEAHAQCAKEIYLQELTLEAAPRSTPDSEQIAVLDRQQAIAEATLREQRRTQQLQANMRMMQFGLDVMNGGAQRATNSPRRSTHTYSIGGQLINCSTLGTITSCF